MLGVKMAENFKGEMDKRIVAGCLTRLKDQIVMYGNLAAKIRKNPTRHKSVTRTLGVKGVNLKSQHKNSLESFTNIFKSYPFTDKQRIDFLELSPQWEVTYLDLLGLLEAE
jgi:hypothetical protein